MTEPSDRLYKLLPAIHRLRDGEQGEPLRALLRVIEEELLTIEEDIGGLYENWFIETCEEWVVPYLAALVGVRGLRDLGSDEYSLRAFVANTLAYRRRKGTAPVIEQVARDLTGWPTRVVEFFQLLSTTQYIKHTRLQNLRTPDLRRSGNLERIGGPFQDAAHTAEVRRISLEQGKYNIPNIGIFVWRLRALSLTKVQATEVTVAPPGRYRVNPLGRDTTMFNVPQTEQDITHLAEEHNVPAPLRRRPLYEELEARRQAIADGVDAEPVWFDDSPPFRLWFDDVEVSFDVLTIANLSGDDATPWQQPPDTRHYTGASGAFDLPITAAVDPVLGRIALSDAALLSPPTRVRVDWAFGAPGRYGGGPYNRTSSVRTGLNGRTFHLVAVVRGDGGTLTADRVVGSLTDAIALWNAALTEWDAASDPTEPRVGVILLQDNSTFVEDLTGAALIELPAHRTLLLLSGQWAGDASTTTLVDEFGAGRLVAQDRRAHLRGSIEVHGEEVDDPAGELIIDGLLIEGRIHVTEGNLASLRVAHCILPPERPAVVVKAHPSDALRKNASLSVTLDHIVSGPLTFDPDAAQTLSVADSLLAAQVDDGTGTVPPWAIRAPGTRLTSQSVTVLGDAWLRELSGSDNIFTATLTVERSQWGCLRYSYVEDADSRTPRRYRCQPDLAVAERQAEDDWETLSSAEQSVESNRVRRRVRPSFTSTDFNDPGFGQLGPDIAAEIKAGSEDSSEMGYLCGLKDPLREANLRSALDTYLRFGLEAGIFHVT